MTAIRAAFKAYRMHQVLIMPRFARLTIALGLATAVFPVDAEYYFNPRFLSNDLAESVDLSAFTGNDSNLLIVFYVQIMPDDFVMQLHRF